MRIFWPLLLLSGLLLSPVLSAQPSTEVTLSVPDQSRAARDLALRAGLDRVLTRLAGARAIREFWIAPSAVLSSYQYRREYSEGEDELRLIVRFDSKALLQALEDQGFAVRDSTPPQILTWVHGPEGWQDTLDVSRNFPQLLSLAQAWAWDLRFPQLDIAERSRVNAQELREGYSAPWLFANRDYALSWNLFVDWQPSETGWQSEWLLADTERVVASFSAAGEKPEELIEQAWAHFNNHIVEQQALWRATVPEQSWRLELLGLSSSGAYLQALSRLDSINASYEIVSASPAALNLRLRWQGTPAQLQTRARDWGWRELQLTPAASNALNTYPALAQDTEPAPATEAAAEAGAPLRRKPGAFVQPTPGPFTPPVSEPDPAAGQPPTMQSAMSGFEPPQATRQFRFEVPAP